MPEERIRAINRTVRELFDEGASIDSIEGRIIEEHCNGDIEVYLSDGARAAVIAELDALQPRIRR
jgi:hypothetical protein